MNAASYFKTLHFLVREAESVLERRQVELVDAAYRVHNAEALLRERRAALNRDWSHEGWSKKEVTQ